MGASTSSQTTIKTGESGTMTMVHLHTPTMIIGVIIIAVAMILCCLCVPLSRRALRTWSRYQTMRRQMNNAGTLPQMPMVVFPTLGPNQPQRYPDFERFQELPADDPRGDRGEEGRQNP